MEALMSCYDPVAVFAYEVGCLKRSPRIQWQRAGVPIPESVAEHSHRAAVLAYIIAHLEGVDPERAATLAIFHDVPETRTTDPQPIMRRNGTPSDAELVAKHQTAGLPAALAASIRVIIADVEAKVTLESICVQDADKLECLLQAREYQAQGYSQLEALVHSMARSMRTATGRKLAERARKVSPSTWWHDVVSTNGLWVKPPTGVAPGQP
jgi:5'-deoxynucleotidase YfbR-like HD superfamily hydrolase